MERGRASRTAEQNAAFRALETRRPASRRLIDDPVAAAFLSRPYRALDMLARVGPVRAGLMKFIDHRWPGVRTSVVARTQLIDTFVRQEAPRARQLVVLGAGFDTRAWRLPTLGELTIFEVDHPDTQRRKRRLLAGRGLDTAAVRFVPTDFQVGNLGDAMHERGYDPQLSTLFLWEGTTNYLDNASVTATLRWCASARTGSTLVFTYIAADVLEDPSCYFGAERVLRSIAKEREPMTFGIDPATLDVYLEDHGLELIDDVGAAAYRELVYGDASRGMRGHEFYRVARARVL